VIWQVVYFFAIEKKELVGSGFGDDLTHYTWQSKKRFVYYQLLNAVFAISFYIFSINSVRAYVNCYPSESPANKKK